MSPREYTASIQRDAGRSSWCVIFRHPLRPKKDGSKGLRIRKGLGTTNEEEARGLADQLSTLLNDESFHNLAARERAAKQFDLRVVAAFYDNLTPSAKDPWAERSVRIPFPGPQDDYARVLMVGTTGSGKTTLVRQLIGSDPEKDRFPSISPAKTTIADIEIITAESPYKAVVTFIDQDRVRQYVEECVAASAIAFFETNSMNELQRRFLIHTEQRFRLSYLLGTPTSVSEEDADEMDDDDASENVSADLTEEEKATLRNALNSYFGRIRSLADELKNQSGRLYKELNIDPASATKEDREAVYELLEELLYDLDDFHAIVDEVASDVENRFEYLTSGELIRNKNGWPVTWYYESNNRQEFLQVVNTFSSNYAPRFGRLLTPLVDGIRVQGPFQPQWTDEKLKLAIMDGEGLGHTPDSSTSVSTNITRKYQNAEAIILVDNAKQPMQGGSLAVLSSLATRGYESKLILCFTHFEHVAGDNLPNVAERKNQVLASVDNAVASIGSRLDESLTRELRRLMIDRVVMVAAIQKLMTEGSKRTKAELKRLVDIANRLKVPVEPAIVCPVYDDANLVLSIQKAVHLFHERWHAKLNLQYHPSERPEHWSRIKALTRRLGEWNTNEYQELRPVADLIQFLIDGFNVFIAQPVRWEDGTLNEEAQQAAKARIKQEFETRIDAYISKTLHSDRIQDWYKAYSDYRGKGSTIGRARKIDEIYDTASPVPGETPSIDLNRFLFELRVIVKESIIAAGGKMLIP